VIAKVEWHPEELYPRVGFIVTNMSRPAERVVAFYNKRGTCEQWIKEGKGYIECHHLTPFIAELRPQPPPAIA
jgi:Transposase DDE domain group 1